MDASTATQGVDAQQVHARVLLLHTGGSLWVDAIGMQGARVEPLVRWLPTSERTELGLVGPALSALACFREAQRLSHLVVALSEGEPPAGESGQVAVALAALWYWRASRRGLPCTRPSGPPVQADRILAATGRLVEEAGADGLFRYAVGVVDGIDDKIAALARRQEEVRWIDLVVPAGQADDVAEAIARHMPDATTSAIPHTWRLPTGRLRLHPVADIEDVQDVVDLVLSESSFSAASPDLEVGSSLEGRFVLRARIGEGGAGTVWRARDGNDHVAIKLLHPHLARDPERLATFFRGARHMQRLAGPGIAKVIHTPGGDGPHRYIAMELLTGGSLTDAVNAGRADLALVLRVIDALAGAHAAGIVHRDVKPQNVLLDDAGNPALVDFDLARVLDSGSATTRSLGTLAYCAPEVLSSGAGAATAASDVYSAAMTAMFVLYGKELPVEALRGPQDFLEHVTAPSPVRWVLSRGLSTDPEDRPADAGALAEALREAIEQGDTGPVYRSPTAQPARSRWPLRTIAILAVLALSVAAWSWMGYRRAVDEAGDARAGAEQEQLVERAWRGADSNPAEAVALLRSAGRLDAAGAARLLASGGASKVWATPDKVLDVDVAADGAIGVGLLGGTVMVLDPRTGEERWRAETPLERAKEVAFAGDVLAAWAPDAVQRGEVDEAVFRDAKTGAPAGLLALSGSPIDIRFGDGRALSRDPERVLFWDLETGLPLREQALAEGTGAALSPDGRTVLVTTPSEQRLERAEGTVLRGPRERDDLVRFAWSGDGSRFVRASAESIAVYDTETLAPVAELPAACHRRVFLDDTGRRALCGGSGNEVSLVRFDTAEVFPLEGHTDRLSVGAFLDEAVITGAFDGGLRVWDAGTGALVATLAGHTALIGAIQPLDDHRIVTGGQDDTVRIWDLSLLWPANEVVARNVRGDVAFHGDRVAWRDADGLLHVDGQAMGPIDLDDRILWTTDGHRVVSAGRDAAVWDLDGTRTSLGGQVRAADVVEVDGALRTAVATGDDDIRLGRFPDEMVKAPRANDSLVQSLVWARPDELLVFPYKGAAIGVGVDGYPVARLDGLDEGVTDIVLRGGRLVAGTWSPTAGVWALPSGERLAAFEGHTADVVAVDLSADGTRAATGSWDGTARVWDAATGAVLATMVPGGEVVDVAFAPDGTRLAVLNRDRRTHIYDVADGSLLGIQPASRAKAIAWVDGGLLTVESDGTVRLWHVAEPPTQGWSADAGARTNLRVCPDGAVVPVQPWPDPASTEAPVHACAVRDEQSQEAG